MAGKWRLAAKNLSPDRIQEAHAIRPPINVAHADAEVGMATLIGVVLTAMSPDLEVVGSTYT